MQPKPYTVESVDVTAVFKRALLGLGNLGGLVEDLHAIENAYGGESTLKMYMGAGNWCVFLDYKVPLLLAAPVEDPDVLFEWRKRLYAYLKTRNDGNDGELPPECLCTIEELLDKLEE